MHNNLPIFKKIQITKQNGSYLSHSESSLLISGDYLIIITINDDLNYVEHNVIPLLEIKSYITK
jgi:hypothetical protein